MRILIIVVPGGGDSAPLTIEQVIEPYFRFRDSGAEVVLASRDGGEPVSISGGRKSTASARRFGKDFLAREALADTLSLDQVFVEDFQAAYCISALGILTPSGDHPASRLIAQLLAAGRPVAVVSSGGGLMITGTSPLLAADALLGALF